MRPHHNGVFGGVQKWPVRSGWDRSGPRGLTCIIFRLRLRTHSALPMVGTSSSRILKVVLHDMHFENDTSKQTDLI
jgi:hypothetical protein